MASNSDPAILAAIHFIVDMQRIIEAARSDSAIDLDEIIRELTAAADGVPVSLVKVTRQ